MKYFRIFSFSLLGLALIAMILVVIQPRYSFEPSKKVNYTAGITTTPPPSSIQMIDGQILLSTYHRPYSEKETYTGENTKTLCEIERFDPELTVAPAHLKSMNTSTNLRTFIYYDEPSWGGSWGSFNGVHGTIFGKSEQVFIKTENDALLVSAKTDFGAALYYDSGELACYPTSQASISKYFGPVTSFHHRASGANSEILFIRGQMTQGCFTLLDKRGDLHLAVFPTQLDTGIAYTLLVHSSKEYLSETSVIWLNTPLFFAAEGTIMALSESVIECGGVSSAILLRNSPKRLDWDGYPFPSP